MSQVFRDLSNVCVFSGLKILSKHSKPPVKSVPYPISPKLDVSSQVPVWHLHWVGVPKDTNVLRPCFGNRQKPTLWNCVRSVIYVKGDINPHRNDSCWVITTLFLSLGSQPFLHVASSSSYTTFPLSGLILRLGCSQSSSACSGILTTSQR